MAKFQYKPLRSSRSIRLIKFLPGPNRRCQMIEVEVEKAPPYVALSYTWGPKELIRSIEVNGCEMRITENLADAIEALYDFVRDRQKMFWADSISINQEDIHERGKQVQIMNTIYRSAELVTIWLGPEADGSGLAFKKLKEWKARIDELKTENSESEPVAIARFFIENPDFFRLDSGQQIGLEAVRRLFRRRWWQRAWIVQEATVMNAARLFLFCGIRCIGWPSIQDALTFTNYAIHSESAGRDFNLNDGMASKLSHFHNRRQNGVHIGLLDVLMHLRAYECEDPRDKVYAALGMAMDVTENDIVPDYTKSVKTVYKDTVRFFLTKSDHHFLDILGAVVTHSPGTVPRYLDSITLPSWTPDWMYRTNMVPLQKQSVAYGYEVNRSVYNACGSLTGTHFLHGDYLYLQGSVVDKITRLWKTCYLSLPTGGLDIEQSWTPQNSTERYFTGETLMTAFNHTVVADVSLAGYPGEVVVSRGFAVNWELVGKDGKIMTLTERRRKDHMKGNVKRATFGRRLFETSRGFIGIGPAATQVADQVYVLLGGQVLYVLRAHDVHPDHHRFVGECYVHGMMDGQAVQDEAYSCGTIILE